MSSQSTPLPSSPMDAADELLQNHMHERMEAIAMDMDFDNPVPSTANPQPQQAMRFNLGPANSPEFLPPVFTGTPISQPTPSPVTTHIVNADRSVTITMLTMDTLASGAETTPSHRYFPPGKKLAPKKALPGDSEISVFDILNTFRRRWFLSVDSLRAQALLAQKAEDGTINWVEFTPQYHAHLVKCAIALVPWLIQKVKKVVFAYILELLNGESPQAFFDLSKGDCQATAAQKERKRLARKRNCASRCDHRRQAEEAVEGHPQQQCGVCGRKFMSCKAAKQH